MYIRDFERKLKEINPAFFIDYSKVTGDSPAPGTGCGIYLRGQKDAPVKGQSSGKLKSYVDQYNNRPIIYVAWATYPSVAEGDYFDTKTGELLHPGWRSILKKLISAGHCSKSKARYVFGYEESDYDRLTYEDRLEFQKRWGN